MFNVFLLADASDKNSLPYAKEFPGGEVSEKGLATVTAQEMADRGHYLAYPERYILDRERLESKGKILEPLDEKFATVHKVKNVRIVCLVTGQTLQTFKKTAKKPARKTVAKKPAAIKKEPVKKEVAKKPARRTKRERKFTEAA